MDSKEAKEMLCKMVQVEGLLRIITNECVSSNCKGDEHDESEYRLVDPRHFVIHKVVDLKDVGTKGQMRAYTAEGDWCQGQPEPLLRRLQEWNMGGTIIEPPRKNGVFSRLFRR